MLERFIFLLSLIVAVVCGLRFLERTWPIAPTPQLEVRDDWLAVIVNNGLYNLLGPITGIGSAMIIACTGVGWIRLPTQGYWYWLSLLIVVVVLDLYTYAYHRLEHAIPFLWAMHSFHHSANAMTFITKARHLWLEKAFTNAFLPIMAVLFQIPPDMALIVGILFLLPDVFAHLNFRFPMGCFITWVNSPQWHRIHHSVLPEHHDKNFATLLPLWDIAFGTAWIPSRNEYPDTGFDPPVRADLIDSIIWPFRHLRRRRAET